MGMTLKNCRKAVSILNNYPDAHRWVVLDVIHDTFWIHNAPNAGSPPLGYDREYLLSVVYLLPGESIKPGELRRAYERTRAYGQDKLTAAWVAERERRQAAWIAKCRADARRAMQQAWYDLEHPPRVSFAWKHIYANVLYRG
jgi:hypothetical protein